MRILDTGYNYPTVIYGYEWGGSLLHKRKNYFLTEPSDINTLLDHIKTGELDFSHENENGFWLKDKGLGVYQIYPTKHTEELGLKVVNNELQCTRFNKVTSLP